MTKGTVGPALAAPSTIPRLPRPSEGQGPREPAPRWAVSPCWEADAPPRLANSGRVGPRGRPSGNPTA